MTAAVAVIATGLGITKWAAPYFRGHAGMLGACCFVLPALVFGLTLLLILCQPRGERFEHYLALWIAALVVVLPILLAIVGSLYMLGP